MDYTQIDSISYEENSSQNWNDYRTNGLGNLRYAMGNFRNNVYGDYAPAKDPNGRKPATDQ